MVGLAACGSGGWRSFCGLGGFLGWVRGQGMEDLGGEFGGDAALVLEVKD
jgi:hypothetical protein